MIVTLCGSTRFEANFIEAQRELSRRLVLCFSLAVLPAHRTSDEGWQDGQWDKTAADLLYFYRIQHSDAILVLGDGYIGQSTAREIIWAKIQGKGMLRHGTVNHCDWEETVARLELEFWDTELLLQAEKVLGGIPR